MYYFNQKIPTNQSEKERYYAEKKIKFQEIIKKCGQDYFLNDTFEKIYNYLLQLLQTNCKINIAGDAIIQIASNKFYNLSKENRIYLTIRNSGNGPAIDLKLSYSCDFLEIKPHINPFHISSNEEQEIELSVEQINKTNADCYIHVNAEWKNNIGNIKNEKITVKIEQSKEDINWSLISEKANKLFDFSPINNINELR